MRALQEDKGKSTGPTSTKKSLSGRETVGVTVATDEKSLQTFQAFVEMAGRGPVRNLDDVDKVFGLYAEERLLIVAPNTRIAVIGAGVNTTKVRILEGKYVDRNGWVPDEAVVLDGAVNPE